MDKTRRPFTGRKEASFGPLGTRPPEEDVSERIRKIIEELLPEYKQTIQYLEEGVGADDDSDLAAKTIVYGERLRRLVMRIGSQEQRNRGLISSKLRRARTTSAAGAANTITCNLYNDYGDEQTTGDEAGITVHCFVVGGGNLNAAVPRLEDNDDIFVAYLPYDTVTKYWYCVSVFQASQDCDDDAELNALASVTSATDKVPYFTGSGTADVADFNDAGRAIVGISGAAANKALYFTSSSAASLMDVTAFARTILDDTDEATFKATVNLEIGTDVLAQQTIGIADDNLVEVDDADAADNDFAKFTANGLEGRSYGEVLSDLSGQAGGAFDFNSQNLTSVGTITAAALTADAGNITVDRTGDDTAGIVEAIGATDKFGGIRYVGNAGAGAGDYWQMGVLSTNTIWYSKTSGAYVEKMRLDTTGALTVQSTGTFGTGGSFGGNLVVTGTITTESDDNWDLNDYTAGTVTDTGYITVTVNGTPYKLLARLEP